MMALMQSGSFIQFQLYVCLSVSVSNSAGLNAAGVVSGKNMQYNVGVIKGTKRGFDARIRL